MAVIKKIRDQAGLEGTWEEPKFIQPDSHAPLIIENQDALLPPAGDKWHNGAFHMAKQVVTERGTQKEVRGCSIHTFKTTLS